ncbi:acyltransferase family protein [Phnomibacter ginsenosidimutans]|uniref:acyltransferase family protein n=1 Tax=Phnomibacter ginsenosidimutans TaxID=2676868 RepID=UPI0018D1F719|nr:acyltransferase [Phnomibacter ginsenosidimutans]
MGIIRFILAISVVLAHAGPLLGNSLVGGQLAVQAFYIISGFYMALILNEKYVSGNRGYKIFIVNRALRLFPIYWFILFATLLYSLAIGFNNNGAFFPLLDIYIHHFSELGWLASGLLIFSNFFILFQDLILFLGVHIDTGQLFFTSDFLNTSPILHKFVLIPQAWTLSLELLFYLIAPFIVRKKLMVIISLLLISAFIKYTLHIWGLEKDPWSYRFFPAELMFFLLGTLAYRVIFIKIAGKRQYKILSLSMLTLLLSATFFYNQIALPGKSALYLTLIFLTLPFAFTFTKNISLDRYIGELSYPIYISHMLVLTVCYALHLESLGTISLFAVILSILLSIFMNETIGKRIERIRQSRIPG